MNSKIKTFYTDKQVCFDSIRESSYSQSPLKPHLLMKRFDETGYGNLLDIDGSFAPISKEDFKIAHTPEYVDNVYNGTGNCRSNALPWSQNLVDSLPYTTGSLYAASKYAIEHPEQIAFAPISGMHHAQPENGSGFCTFSGQVISAIKIYQETGKVCAYLDLDGHFGNSIEDTRDFNPLLNKAIPKGCNINPRGDNAIYLDNFIQELKKLSKKIVNGEVDYVVFAHGADSHSDDDLGGQCGTWYWLECAKVFATWVNEVSKLIGKKLPVVLALFGGYRKDDYNTVLDLHIKSILTCSNIIYNQENVDTLEIDKKKYKTY
jgi:acetoin utilization deacetylase AcuC-like enzyme